MGFLDRFTKKALSNSLGTVMRNYGAQPKFRPQQQVTGITYKAIDKIGLTLSVYEPIVLSRSGEPVVNHPLYNLFNNPTPGVTASDFVHMYGMLMSIYGETFWYTPLGELTSKPKELILLNPQQMELKISNGELIGYVLHKEGGEQVPLELEEIIHDKYPNPFNHWRGLSVLEKAALYVDTEIATATFTLNYINNNASPSGIVTLPEMGVETFKQFTAQWREGYEGPHNAGKTAFIRGGEAKFQAVGATLKDIDQKITREMAKDDVLMMLDVPKPLLGLTDDVGFGRGNVETLKYIYAESKLEPMMKRLDRIYQTLADRLTRAEGTKVTHISPVPEDKEHMLELYKAGTNVWITPNEARQAYNLEPIKDGDVLGEPKAQETKQETKSVKMAKKLTKAQQIKKDQDTKEQMRQKTEDLTNIYASKLKSAISRFSTAQENKVIDKINAQAKSYEEWLFEVKEESIGLADVLLPIVIELMEVQSEDVAHFITGELLTISPELRAAVQNDILKISGLYNEDTLRALEKTLNQGQASGESLVKLKKRVEQVYSDAQGYRAERIARTESARAANRAAELTYKASGYSTVEWFINPGACEFCRTFAGKTKIIGGTYAKVGEVVTGSDGNQLKIDYDDIASPPLHPNCTCSLVPGAES